MNKKNLFLKTLFILFFLKFFDLKAIENKIIVTVDNEPITSYELKNKILTQLILSNQEINQDGFIISSHYLTQKSSINLNSSEYSLQLTRGQVSQYDTLYIVAIPNKNSNVGAKIEIIESS